MNKNLAHVWSDETTLQNELARFSRLCAANAHSKASVRVARRIAISRVVRSGGDLAKRMIDLTGAMAGILMLAPVMVITAFLIRVEDRGSVLFVQQRVGRGGRLFGMYKFRSMVRDAEKRRADLECRNESAGGVLFKMRDDPRVTRIGRVIRRLSIDELPQLFNVLRGDMSLVGPRPALPSEVARYTVAQRSRLEAKPGITCLWQIGGRSEIGIEGQVALDLQYMREQSAILDAKIIAKTIPAVVGGKGAY